MVSPPKHEMLVTVTFDVHLWYGPFHESWLSKSQIGSSFVYKHPNFHKKKKPTRRKCSEYCDNCSKISLTILLYHPFPFLRCARIREQDGDQCAKGESPAVSSTRSSQHKAAGILEAMV